MGELPIFGTTIRRVHCGRRLHRLPTETVFAGLLNDCVTFLAPGWYACVLLADGSGVMRGRMPSTREPAQDIRDKMMAIGEMLNRELDHLGHWIVAWAGGHLHMLWRDADGDLQFTCEIDEPWPRVKAWPDTVFAERAETSYQQWLEHMRAAERKQDETYRRALGEAPPTSAVH